MHIVITGASSGIGESLAREFDRTGNRITLVARRKELLDKLASELSCQTLVFPLDLSDLDHCCDFIDPAEKEFGEIDILINNAGIQRVAPAVELPIEDAEKLMRLNLMSPVRIIRRVLPHMLHRSGGMIINVASIASFNPAPYMSYYSSSKAALATFSETLNYEVKDHGVHVVTVYPGPIRTPMETRVMTMYDDNAKSMIERLPVGDPDDLALRVRRAVEEKHDRVVFPDAYGLGRHFPTITTWLTEKFSPTPSKFEQ